MLDMIQQIASDNWKRPVYFATMMAPNSYLGLEEFFRLEGLAYRLVPVEQSELTPQDMYFGWVGQDTLYKNLTETYLFRGLDDPTVYFDEHIRQVIVGASYQSAFYRLAMSYSTDIQRALQKLAVYEVFSKTSGNREALLTEYVERQRTALREQPEEEEPDEALSLQINFALELLGPPLLSEAEIDSTQTKLVSEVAAKREKLLSVLEFLDQHIPPSIFPFSYADLAMRVRIYDNAQLPAPLEQSIDRLVDKGMQEVQALQAAGYVPDPNETAFSAIFMGIQYYQESGMEEKARAVTDSLQALIGNSP